MARTERIEVRVTVEEKAALQARADAADRALGDYLRQVGLGAAMFPEPGDERNRMMQGPDSRTPGRRQFAAGVNARASQGLGKGYFPPRPKG